MRNWCLAPALGILLTPPLCAQQKDADEYPGGPGTAAAKSSMGGSNAALSDPAAFQTGIFALPAVPQPKPFPKAGRAAKDASAPGQLVPRYEVGGMYDYVNFNPGSPFSSFSNHGATGSFTYNASRWLGLTAELGGYRFKNRNLSGTPVNGSIVSYLFGPRLNWRKFDYFVPFAEFLLGGSHGGASVIGVGSQSSFSVATGGVVDMILSRNWAWRVAQLDYFMTKGDRAQETGHAVTAAKNDRTAAFFAHSF